MHIYIVYIYNPSILKHTFCDVCLTTVPSISKLICSTLLTSLFWGDYSRYTIVPLQFYTTRLVRKILFFCLFVCLFVYNHSPYDWLSSLLSFPSISFFLYSLELPLPPSNLLIHTYIHTYIYMYIFNPTYKHACISTLQTLHITPDKKMTNIVILSVNCHVGTWN